MDIASIYESLYQYLYNVRVYDKTVIASFVGNTIDADAYKRITGDDYVPQTA